MKALLLATAALLVGLPVQAETAYLVLKSMKNTTIGGITVVTIPMTSLDQCEEQGALLTTSKRFDRQYNQDVFECITGK